ncbi:MAG: TonB-dependent receptor [Proteobacteria bacterium]|nr:TonB-dependent receptor [Pseudomonadota bacterium]
MTGILVRMGMAATLAAILPAGAPLAQTADKSANSLDEIVVTATRREERLQDVPISVSAFSQEKLDSQGLKNIDDLSRLSPGMTFSRNGTGSNANYNDENSDISIRGIDSAAGSSTTGVYLDDTPIQSRHIGFGAVNVFPQMFDVDRVEVLRGPQGTLFGAGAEGGVVRFITPAPNLVGQTGYVRAETSMTRYGDPSYELGAAMGTALIDNTLGLRVSASYRRDGGWVDRVNYTQSDPNALLPTLSYAGTTEKASNWQDTMTLRAALKWKVSDAVTVTPSIYYQRLHINDTAIYWTSLSDPANGVFRNGNALTNPSTDPWYLGAVKVDWDVSPSAHLVSTTSYYARDQHSTSDYTQYLRATWALYGLLYAQTPFPQPTPYPNTYPRAGDAGYAPFHDQQHNFYQEFRIASTDANARLTWNAGLYFSHTNENIPEDIYDNNLEAETGGGVCAWVGVPCPAGLIYHGPEDRIIEKQIAAFGELSFKFLDVLKATVGLRVSKIDVDGTTGFGGAFTVTPLDPLTTGEAKSSEKPVTPKFVLAYQPDRDNMYYVSASKGYRAGGINIQVAAACAPDLATLGLPLGSDGQRHVPGSYTSDYLWSYEIGAKNTLLDRTLQVNSSLFVIDWNKIQQQVYLPSCGEQFFANLGKVQSRGGDIDITYKPVHELTLGLTVAYTDARYTQNSCAGTRVAQGAFCADPTGASGPTAPVVNEGDRLLGAPWSFLASAEYATQLSSWGGRTVYVRFDYQRTTAQTALTPGLDDRNALFDDSVPGLPATADLSIRAGLRFNGLDVSLFGTNLTNAHPLLFSSRDIAWDCASGAHCNPNVPYNPATGAGSTDNLYFGRGVRPRTVGITATYRY